MRQPRHYDHVVVVRDGPNRNLLYGPLGDEEAAALVNLLERTEGFRGACALRRLIDPSVLERLAMQSIATERKRARELAA